MTTSTLTRGFYALPILGWIARDIATGGDENIWYALLIFLTCVVLAVQTWGIVALSMSALAMVPIVFILLIRITLG